MRKRRKIKVLQAIRQGLIGGGESHVLSLVAALDKEEFEPVVLSFTDGPMITRLKEMEVRNFVIPSPRPFDVSSWKKVGALIESEEIDIVHAHGSRAASNLFFPAKLCKRPLLYTIHGWSFHDDHSYLQKQMRIWSERLITGGTAGNISVSDSNRETGVRVLRKFRSKVINNGIDLDHFNPDRVWPDVREELGIPAGHTLVGYIARITKQKDPLGLLKAFKYVLDACSNITLLVVGEGDMKEEMIALAKSLEIDNHVVFLPFRQDIPALLKAIDIFCLPSLWEGLPIGLLEAMAMRKAVVVTAVDGCREVVQDRKNGLIIPVGDPILLAEAIVTLHINIPLREHLQQQASETVAVNYSVEGMASQVAALYHDVYNNQRYDRR
jgi:glycosyltransferase involved in cell wall biosynthesis